MPKAMNVARFSVRARCEEFRVGRIGAGIAAFDVVDAEIVEDLGDAPFVLRREVDTCVCAPSRNVVSKR